MKFLKKLQLAVLSYSFFSNLLSKRKFKARTITLAFIFLAISIKAYGLDTVSFKQYSILNTPIPSRIDLTKLPIGKTFQVNHSDFTLQFFFNNKDIFGYIFKRKPKIGIIAHLCFYRSCEESPYDLRQVIAKAFEAPYDQTFFSVKFPRQIQYEFQGLEFLPHK